jgi:hypothetical protein
VKNEKGFILIVSYLLLAALSTFSLAVFNWGSSYIQSSDRNKKKIVAFNMAEAGFDQAYYNVKNSVVSSFPYSGSYTSMNSTGIQGGYQTTITDMGSNIRKIQVTGYSPAQSSTSDRVESRTIVGYIQMGTSSAFNFGVFAKDDIQMSGNAEVDSYNSTNGAYGGSNVGSNGDIGTDSTGSSTVSLSGNVEIHGDVVTGMGSTPSSVISTSGNAEIDGTQSAASALVNPQTITGSGTDLGSLSVSGNNTYTLAAGTYSITNLSISGNGRISASGPVTLYISGSVSIAGNGIGTSSSKPPNMLIYVTGSSNVSISGNGNLYAGIYAPNSRVSNTGNGEIYGAVVADTYHQSGNGDVHFDEALKEVQGGTSATSMLSWQEQGLANQG